MEAAVAMVLGTVAVLVSQMCIEDMGIFNSRLATYVKNKYFQVWQSFLGRVESFFFLIKKHYHFYYIHEILESLK